MFANSALTISAKKQTIVASATTTISRRFQPPPAPLFFFLTCLARNYFQLSGRFCGKMLFARLHLLVLRFRTGVPNSFQMSVEQNSLPWMFKLQFSMQKIFSPSACENLPVENGRFERELLQCCKVREGDGCIFATHISIYNIYV